MLNHNFFIFEAPPLEHFHLFSCKKIVYYISGLFKFLRNKQTPEILNDGKKVT